MIEKFYNLPITDNIINSNKLKGRDLDEKKRSCFRNERFYYKNDG